MSSAAAPTPPADIKVMARLDLTRRLVACLKDEAVVAGIGNTNFDLFNAGHRKQNFYMLGSMGLACPIAMGVALAQPERGVIALEGDGSILMSLGCLATIGMVRPRNLTIVIMDNGMYQITGKQPAATGRSADIAAIARGAGITAEWARDEAHFETLLDRRFNEGGPILIAAKIDDATPKGQTPRDPMLIRNQFMKGLGTARGGVFDD